MSLDIMDVWKFCATSLVILLIFTLCYDFQDKERCESLCSGAVTFETDSSFSLLGRIFHYDRGELNCICYYPELTLARKVR